MKNGKIVLTSFKSIQAYNVFVFSFLLDYSCFMMYILDFLTTKKSAYCFSFMIYIQKLYFTYRGILSTKKKGSLSNFCFVVKVCVQMNQRVTRHLSERFLTEKKSYFLI